MAGTAEVFLNSLECNATKRQMLEHCAEGSIKEDAAKSIQGAAPGRQDLISAPRMEIIFLLVILSCDVENELEGNQGISLTKLEGHLNNPSP